MIQFLLVAALLSGNPEPVAPFSESEFRDQVARCAVEVVETARRAGSETVTLKVFNGSGYDVSRGRAEVDDPVVQRFCKGRVERQAAKPKPKA